MTFRRDVKWYDILQLHHRPINPYCIIGVVAWEMVSVARVVIFVKIWSNIVSKSLFTQNCDLRATFERPGKWSGCSVVAQTQKVMFLCNCCSTILLLSLNDQSCCSGAKGRAKEAEWRQNHCQGGWWVAVVAEWRHSGRHCDRSMDAIGRSKEAQSWWYKEGRSVAQIDTQCSQLYVLFTGRPMVDHCASILPPRRCVCLPPASFEWPVSGRPPRRPLCDCFEHAQNFTATMASLAMSERPVYHHWTTKATVLLPFCLQQRPGQFCGRTMEAARSQPLCKGGISDFQLCFP